MPRGRLRVSPRRRLGSRSSPQAKPKPRRQPRRLDSEIGNRLPARRFGTTPGSPPLPCGVPTRPTSRGTWAKDEVSRSGNTSSPPDWPGKPKPDPGWRSPDGCASGRQIAGWRSTSASTPSIERIDVLPDRSAPTLAVWLREFPGAEYVCHDGGIDVATGWPFAPGEAKDSSPSCAGCREGRRLDKEASRPRSERRRRLTSVSKDSSSPGADRKDRGRTGQHAREHVNVDDLARNPRSER